MQVIARELLDIRSGIEKLTSLSPGQGYDFFGNRISELASQPIDIHEAKLIIESAEAESPNFLAVIQNASISSEMELELFHANRILCESPIASDLHDCLFKDYQYDWFMGRSKLESSLISSPDGEAEIKEIPIICYFGLSGIPFTALAIQRHKPSRIIWFDPYKNTRTLSDKILKRLNIQTIEMHDFSFSAIEAFLSRHHPAYVSVLDAGLIDSDLLSLLKRYGVDNISFVTTHGLNQLMYPMAPEELISEFFEFKEGYYPERLSGMPDRGWKPSKDLSFISLALYR